MAAALTRLLGPRRTTPESPTVWDASAYLATDLWVAIPAFTAIVTGLALSVGLAITVVLAVPCAWATVWFARLHGNVERWRLWAFLDRDVPAPDRPTERGILAGLRAHLGHRPTWREIGHAAAHLPVACLTFAAMTVAWTVPLGLITAPFVINALPSEKLDFWLFTMRPGWGPWIGALVGLCLIPAAVAFVRGVAVLRSRMSTALLSRTEADVLRARVTRLEETRSQAVDAAEVERRRIERDLHDGAQQRLVSLAMDLGMAREKLAADPETAAALIDDAHDEAKRAIGELRDLARGIHPAVLTDRGLGAALQSVASRSSVPVDLQVSLDHRPPETIEGIAYFIVSEALTNVAKHAEATSVRVAAALKGNRLVLEISDNGRGGANPDGSGLRGLAERVAAVDGWFHVASPDGGPTTITAELPCG
jgi:signal transduction histidine kinase